MFLKYIFTINTLKHITLFKIRRYSYMFRSFWTILRECYVCGIEVASILYSNTTGNRHINKARRHNLNTQMHAVTTPNIEY